MPTIDLSVYTQKELNDLEEQVKREILNRSNKASEERMAKWMSPAYAPLRHQFQKWWNYPYFNNDYAYFMHEVGRWAQSLGVADTSDDWVSRMDAALDANPYDFDEFVWPSD